MIWWCTFKFVVFLIIFLGSGDATQYDAAKSVDDVNDKVGLQISDK